MEAFIENHYRFPLINIVWDEVILVEPLLFDEGYGACASVLLSLTVFIPIMPCD
ncbi:hypothetical protein [Shewanella psychrotolerans]|uniref:hypothetical protein n=1 Tax=Shewanella psychrotolerans TaxID=2864206 RepID=UPI001C65B2D2|nr:hypothetical protein [Shewanella psychrotolerans]QYJ99803.1 hypothetical protein K0I62_10000 [Shewanella psychrotolerans]